MRDSAAKWMVSSSAVTVKEQSTGASSGTLPGGLAVKDDTLDALERADEVVEELVAAAAAEKSIDTFAHEPDGLGGAELAPGHPPLFKPVMLATSTESTSLAFCSSLYNLNIYVFF